MGACFSSEKGKSCTDGKCQSSKSMKGRGKTVTPVLGTPLTNTKKGEINRFSHSSEETTIHNLVHLSSDRSVTAHSKPEVASVNFHVNEVEEGHTRTESYGINAANFPPPLPNDIHGELLLVETAMCSKASERSASPARIAVPFPKNLSGSRRSGSRSGTDGNAEIAIWSACNA